MCKKILGTTARKYAFVFASSLAAAGSIGVPEAFAGDGSGRLEGTWNVQITVRNCATGAALVGPFPAMASFARGGAMTTVDSAFNPSLRSPGLGAWRRVQGHHFTATVQAFLFGADGALSGRQLLRQRITLLSPLEFRAQVSTQVFDKAGNVLATGCATSQGRRLD